MRLVVKRLGQSAHDLARELVAAGLDQKAIHVLGAVLFVFDEDRDQVFQRFVLQLVELLALLLALGAVGALRRFEHRQKALRRLVGLAQAPQRPGALEQREVVELALVVVEHLLVFSVGGLVVRRVLRELVLGARHVRVRHEAALRKPLDDLVEADERFVELALFRRQKAVDVQREIVVLERLVFEQHLAKALARLFVVRHRRLAAQIRGRLLPFPEGGEELVARLFPLELTDAKQRFRHLGRVGRRFTDQLGQERMSLLAQTLTFREVLADPAVDLVGQPRAQAFGDLQVDLAFAGRLLLRFGALLDRRPLAFADLALGAWLDRGRLPDGAQRRFLRGEGRPTANR